MIRYTKDHEWIEGPGEDGLYKIGISKFATDSLGDIVYVDLDLDIGESFEKDGCFGSIEAVKTVSDLFIPIECTVVEVNNDLEEAPEKINANPLDAWIIKVELSETAEDQLCDLISEEQYLKDYK